MKKIVEFVLKIILGFLIFSLGICGAVIIAIPIGFLVKKAECIILLILIVWFLRIMWCIGSAAVEVIKRAKGEEEK